MDPHLPISPPPTRGPRGADLPAYVSNGLIGLRVRENPLQAGMCIVSGFVGEHHETRVEAAVAGPYPLAATSPSTACGRPISRRPWSRWSKATISQPAS